MRDDRVLDLRWHLHLAALERDDADGGAVVGGDRPDATGEVEQGRTGLELGALGLRLGLLLVQDLLLGVELGETVDDLLGHRRSRLLRLSLGAVELLARLVELGLPGLQLRRPRRELRPPGVDLLLLGRRAGPRSGTGR